MSKNIIMRRNNGAEAAVNGVKRLQVGAAWLPEDETSKTAVVTIDTLGSYPAARAGLYGFSEADVDVQLPQSGTTRAGVGFTIYVDSSGKPHIAVEGKQ